MSTRAYTCTHTHIHIHTPLNDEHDMVSGHLGVHLAIIIILKANKP